MEQTTTSAEPIPARRPDFLTVLCILSYIGSGLWALFSLAGIFASGMIMKMMGMGEMNELMEQMQQMQQIQGGDSTALTDAMLQNGGMMGIIFSFFIWICAASLVMSALSIFGVIKMWQLKKSGFWIYTIVNGLTILLGFFMGSILGPLIGIGFIIMYGLNLKHMN